MFPQSGGKSARFSIPTSKSEWKSVSGEWSSSFQSNITCQTSLQFEFHFAASSSSLEKVCRLANLTSADPGTRSGVSMISLPDRETG